MKDIGQPLNVQFRICKVMIDYIPGFEKIVVGRPFPPDSGGGAAKDFKTDGQLLQAFCPSALPDEQFQFAEQFLGAISTETQTWRNSRDLEQNRRPPSRDREPAVMKKVSCRTE